MQNKAIVVSWQKQSIPEDEKIHAQSYIHYKYWQIFVTRTRYTEAMLCFAFFLKNCKWKIQNNPKKLLQFFRTNKKVFFKIKIKNGHNFLKEEQFFIIVQIILLRTWGKIPLLHSVKKIQQICIFKNFVTIENDCHCLQKRNFF